MPGSGCSASGPEPPEPGSFVRAARGLGVDLRAVEVQSREARDINEADLVLVRLDQIVAWRGLSDTAAGG